MDPTIDFNLLSFTDLQAATYSQTKISRRSLRERILFARTGSGNYAKLQVQSGDDLRITRLTVYNAKGCIVKIAFDLTIHNGFACDLDEACETSKPSDFWWRAEPSMNRRASGLPYLKPTRAAFHRCPDINDCHFTDLKSAPFEARAVDGQALLDQLLFCRTSNGRYAKLLVSTGYALHIRRLVVYNPDGSPHLGKKDIDLPPNCELDIDSGTVKYPGFEAKYLNCDLRWQLEGTKQSYLTPCNGARISFASHFRLHKYRQLLGRPDIRNALIFEDSSGIRPYDKWEFSMQAQLWEMLHSRETGAALPLWGPPSLASDLFMDACDARKIYLAHVVQSLWVEANGLVQWSLSEANSEHLEHLFDSRKLLPYSPEGYCFGYLTTFIIPSWVPIVTQWDPVYSYDFLVDHKFVADDEWGTVQLLGDWVRSNLIHAAWYEFDYHGPFATQADQWEYTYGYRGPPLVERMIEPLPGEYRMTPGCLGTDGFVAAVLRTVNIPVRMGESLFTSPDMFPIEVHHSRPEFFSVGKGLAHGDDFYTGSIRVGYNNVPIGEIFLDMEKLKALIDDPEPLPGMTVVQTASHNHGKHLIQLAVKYKTNFLLYLRSKDIASNADASSSLLIAALQPFYSEAEIKQIIKDCDMALTAIPGGKVTTYF